MKDASKASASNQQVSALHDKLYVTKCHPGDVYYIVLTRVAMGHFERTKTSAGSATSLRTSKSIWAPGKARLKELTSVDGTVPPILHHSLRAELGPAITRHREFLQFHKNRTYPAYVLAYQRVLNGSCV